VFGLTLKYSGAAVPLAIVAADQSTEEEAGSLAAARLCHRSGALPFQGIVPARSCSGVTAGLHRRKCFPVFSLLASKFRPTTVFITPAMPGTVNHN